MVYVCKVLVWKGTCCVMGELVNVHSVIVRKGKC